MRFGTALGVAVLATAWSVGSGPTASAADMPSYDTPTTDYGAPDRPLEFGTGWYLRGDASFGPEDRPKLLLQDGSPAFDRRGSTFGYGFGIGAGYKFNSVFRADVTGDYLDPFDYRVNIPCGSTCAINQSTTVQRWDGLVNAYLDLGDWFGLTPYVGAGAGVAGTHQDGSIGIDGAPLTAGVMDPRTGTLVTGRVPSRTDYSFAWAGMAGVSYAFGPHMLVDLGYRYLDLGKTTISLFPSATVSKSISEQQIRLGVRYMID